MRADQNTITIMIILGYLAPKPYSKFHLVISDMSCETHSLMELFVSFATLLKNRIMISLQGAFFSFPSLDLVPDERVCDFKKGLGLRTHSEI